AVQNKREIIPPEIPAFLRDLIENCWQTDAKERPTAQKCFEILDAQFSLNKDAPWHPTVPNPSEQESNDCVSEMDIASDSIVQPSSLRQSFFYHKPPRGKMLSLPGPQKEPPEAKRVQSAALTPKPPGSPK
ncbi:MAG: hypothetical protein K2Q33_02595, partial [Gammaproteobacteria bacterium]|nr:hypothetical protein [Gammaproteobacteria bacterium]